MIKKLLLLLKDFFFSKLTILEKIVLLLSFLFCSICIIFPKTIPIMFSLAIAGIFIYQIYERVRYSRKYKEEYKKGEWEDHIMNKDHWL